MNDKLSPKESQEGILVLPTDTEIGKPIVDVLGLNDEILELDLTPNRSDCLSMLGAAYEVSAILGRELSLPNPEKEMLEVQDARPIISRLRLALTSSATIMRHATLPV